jgi:hypothetical protein
LPTVSESITNPGLTKLRVLSAATTNLTSVKAAPTKVVNGVITNTTAAVKYVKFYDKASAPVPASDTPVMTLPIAANSSLYIYDIAGDDGIYFHVGFGYAIVGAQIDTDVTAVALGDVVMNLGYIF